MSEKTEAPTPRKLGEARAEGQVARSVELNAAIALIVSAWLLRGSGGKLVQELQNLMVYSISVLPSVEFSGSWLQKLFLNDATRLLPSLGLIVVGLMATGIIVTVSQTGFLFAHKKLRLHPERLNPLSGFQRLFSLNGFVELAKALLKLLIVGWVAYSFLRDHIEDMLTLIQTDFRSALSYWVDLALSLISRVGSTYLVLAIADYAYQRWQLTKSLKMTKEEVKEDAKRAEGDPLIKGRIRGQQRRMARMRMMANVRKADVVITNPTHLAVAVRYNQQEMNAPKVLAKGAHHTAERIVAIARTHNIPVLQNIPVARALYRTVDIDQEIPPQLYTALAEVLAYVYRLRGRYSRPAIASAKR